MLRKLLTIILVLLLAFFIWNETPVSSSYYIGKASNLYSQGLYKDSLPLFERGLRTNPSNEQARMMYVQALSKLEPTYSVQKKLYDISQSEVSDRAKEFAKSQVILIKNKLVEGVEDNYIYNAISGKEIIHWDMQKFPLKVYIEASYDIPSYYKKNIEKAFNEWATRSQFLRFEQVFDDTNADIIIKFRDYTNENCNGENCSYTVAYTEPSVKNENVLQKMHLTFYKTNPAKIAFSPLEIYNTALHEIGHTLGIMGHSDNSSDVMYSSGERATDLYSIYRSESQYLSMRDLKTMALLYKMAPTICNTKNLVQENMLYPPLILGSNDEILNMKLTELKRYIKNYPDFAAGYINISSVYADLGDENSAFNSLDEAERLANTTDEKYLVDYNRAVLYFNKQDFKNSLHYAQKANVTKSTPEVQELIKDVSEFIKN